MSAAEGAEVRHEIIIVKRAHLDHDEGHHGGGWKIAFADFMTAMMCFFLVMWLINASNEQTKASVASYFNPVKLIDRNSSRKGLEDIGDGPNAIGMEAEIPQNAETRAGSEGQAKGGSEREASATESSDTARTSDQHLFADPYAVLAEIVAETGKEQNISAKGDGGAQTSGPASGASGGESYRDPFAPDFWSQQLVAPDLSEASAEAAATTPLPEPDSEAFPEAAPEVAAAAVAEAAPLPMPETAPAEPEASAPAEKAPAAGAKAVAREIEEELAKAFKPGEKFADDITVVASDKGVIISITDDLEFGMFEVGSAVPRRDLVLAMEKIAAAIAAHPGAVSIDGHTDGRPFMSEAYDNWRLSSARAHSAYYMLVRAGLAEARVTEVAGFADRKLKNPNDPLAAENRRIEILLETGG